MVQRVHVILEDDLDGGEASETFQFSFDGHQYEIDLNEQNAETFRKVMTDYLAHARMKTGPKRRRSGPQAAQVRQWARDHGYDVPERGRIPKDIVEAFNAA